MLKSLFRKATGGRSGPLPSVPDDVRVYAIGDIHGRLDLFERMLALIDADHAARPAKRQVVILLGDLIDRGPESAQVVARAMALHASAIETHMLAGNHEEMFLLALTGDSEAVRLFARVGGRETMLSYGMSDAEYDRVDFEELAAMMRALVPQSHMEFIGGMADVVEMGDYAFVHAGIKPGVPLAEQRPSHLRWIRGEFLNHRGAHPRFIVHGHTITETVDEQPNRIGIDTGAYASGRLTALALDGSDRWFIEAT